MVSKALRNSEKTGPQKASGSWQIKRDAKSGKLVTVSNASKVSKGVVKSSAEKRSAALTRLANR